MTAVLELDRITKRFGSILANDDVSLSLAKGEILALLGENGAGKTTLMNILFGHYAADKGEVRVNGRVMPPGKPRAAIDAGVGMVHQHFTLSGNLTVLENVMLGSEPMLRLRSERGAARTRLMALADRFGLPVSPDAKVSRLSVGERQRVEILKALYRDAGILILDEPTAVLAKPEADQLFETLRSMTAGGLSLIFISHKLREVMAASDRVAVLRGGRMVAGRRTCQTSPQELAELMVGRRIDRPVRHAHRIGAPVLEADGITVREDGETRLDGVSFTIHAGEILGMVGVSGNGQGTLGALLSGLVRPAAGRLMLEGRDVGHLGPRGLIEAGVARVPEDRHAEGVVGEMSVWENAVLERLRSAEFSRHGFVRRPAARQTAATLIERVRSARCHARHAGAASVGGQHAETDPRPLPLAEAEIHPRQSAHAGPRRGGHRGGACRAPRGAGRGGGDPADLGRTGRGAGAFGPVAGDRPGPRVAAGGGRGGRCPTDRDDDGRHVGRDRCGLNDARACRCGLSRQHLSRRSSPR